MRWLERFLFRTFRVKGILVLTLLAFAGNSFAQSLADAARKERERQRSSQSKVVIVGSGSRSTSTPGPAATATKPAGTAGTAKPGELTDNKGRDEKYWRTAFQKAREDAKRAEVRLELLDLKVKELNTLMLRQSDVYSRESRILPEIAATQKEIEDTRKAVEQSRKNIADLEDELRRSGGPAGWAR